MTVYLAPPKGPSEKVAFIEWLNANGLKPEILDDQPIGGPLILAGGADIGKDLNRDTREFRWIQEAITNGYPIIGVCRGMQILNHFFGGVVENIAEELVEAHAAAEFSDNADHSGRPSQHHIITDQDGNTISVNSRHHQYCAKVADNFTVTHIGGAIPEAFSDESKKIWAVQWHPERGESENNTYPLDKLFAK